MKTISLFFLALATTKALVSASTLTLQVTLPALQQAGVDAAVGILDAVFGAINGILPGLGSPASTRIGPILGLEAEITTTVNGVSLSSNSANNIQVDAVPGGSDQETTFQSGVENLSVVLGDLTTAVQFSFGGIPLPNCGLGVSTSGSIDRFDLNVNTAVVPDESQANVAVSTLALSPPQLNIGSSSLVGDCGSVGGLQEVVDAFFTDLNDFLFGYVNDFSTELTNQLNAATADILNDIGTLVLPLPGQVNLDFSGRILDVAPRVETLRALSSAVESSADLKASARLTEPSFRNGFSYVPNREDNVDVIAPADSRLVNMNIGANGLNEFMASGWYLMWSFLATNPDSLSSPLCQENVGDPCAFPPLDWVAGFLDNLLLSFTFLLVNGPMWNFSSAYVVNAPRVEFESGAANGVASGGIILKADSFFGMGSTSELFRSDIRVGVGAQIPEYDSTTGIFSKIGVSSVFIGFDNLNIGGPFGFLLTPTVMGPLEAAINWALGLGVTSINDIIDDALGTLVFKVPDVDVPFLDLKIVTEFADASADAIPSNGGGVLKFGSNLVVKTINTGGRRLSAPPVAECTVYDSEAYRQASDPSSPTGVTYTTTFSDAEGGTKVVMVRRTPSGDVQEFVANQWTTLGPAP